MNINKTKQIIINVLLSLFFVLILFETANAAALTDTLDTLAKGPWTFILSFIDYVAVIGLIFISFVNILNLKIDTYAIKKALPMLILGIILANLSWFFCRMFTDLAEVIMSWLVNIASPEGNDMIGAVWGIVIKKLLPVTDPVDLIKTFFEGDFASVGQGLGMTVLFALGSFLLIIPMIFFLLIWLMFIGRGYAIIFLTILSPLAFIMLAIPLTQKFFQQWLSIFLKFVFLGPLMYFMFYVILELDKILKNTPGVTYVANFFLVIIGLYAAVKIPFSLGGSIGTSLMGLGSKASSFLGKGAGRQLDSAGQNITKGIGRGIGNKINNEALKNFEGVSVLGAIGGIAAKAEEDHQIRMSSMAGKGTGENLYGQVTNAKEAIFSNPLKYKETFGAGGSFHQGREAIKAESGARQNQEEIARIKKSFQPQGNNPTETNKNTADILKNYSENKKLGNQASNQIKSNLLESAENAQLDEDLTNQFINASENKSDAERFIKGLQRINSSNASAKNAIDQGYIPTHFAKDSKGKRDNVAERNHILQQLENSATGKNAEKVIRNAHKQLQDIDWNKGKDAEGNYSTSQGTKISSAQIHAVHDFLSNQKRNNTEIFNQNELGETTLATIRSHPDATPRLYSPHEVNTSQFRWGNSKNSTNFSDEENKIFDQYDYSDYTSWSDDAPSNIDYANNNHAKILDEYSGKKTEIGNQSKQVLERIKSQAKNPKIDAVLGNISTINNVSEIDKHLKNNKITAETIRNSTSLDDNAKKMAQSRLTELQKLSEDHKKISYYDTESQKLTDARAKVNPQPTKPTKPFGSNPNRGKTRGKV